jgi:hypothetical protein
MILNMRFSWRLGFRMLLVVLVGSLLWVRIASLRHAHTPAKPTTDLGATMPLNQPGGGVAPAGAYEVYSALYKAPMPEPLAFSEDSATDIPQVNGSCLRPVTPQEHEMTDAFVAANQQSHRWELKFSSADVPGNTRARCPAMRKLQATQVCAVPGSSRV